MRADKDAFATLDAQIRFPNRDFQGDVALFPLGGAGGEGTVDGHGRNGDGIAIEGDHRAKHIADEGRGFGRDGRAAGEFTGDFFRHLDFVQVDQGLVDCGVVFLDNGLTTLAIGFLDGFLDLVDCIFTRQDPGDGKEAGLHDGVDAPTHAGLFGDIIGIDGVELELLLDDILLRFLGQLIPDFCWAVKAVHQEDSAGLGILGDVEAFQEGELVAGNKVGGVGGDQVGSLDRFGTKAQVRDG